MLANHVRQHEAAGVIDPVGFNDAAEIPLDLDGVALPQVAFLPHAEVAVDRPLGVALGAGPSAAVGTEERELCAAEIDRRRDPGIDASGRNARQDAEAAAQNLGRADAVAEEEDRGPEKRRHARIDGRGCYQRDLRKVAIAGCFRYHVMQLGYVLELAMEIGNEPVPQQRPERRTARKQENARPDAPRESRRIRRAMGLRRTITAVSGRARCGFASSRRNARLPKFATAFVIMRSSSSKKPRLTKANSIASCSRLRASAKAQNG